MPMGREPAGEKTPAAHGSASTLLHAPGVAAMRRSHKTRPGQKAGAGTIFHVRNVGTKEMARARNDKRLSPECMAAFERLTKLAHALAATLTGDAPAPDGTADTPRTQALAMAMIFFLLRADPDDIEAALFAKGSLEKIPFGPGLPAPMRHPPLAALL
jgi:hypothetical protein